MKDSRIGESLWFIWDSPGSLENDYIVFYTEDHVDVDNELVRRALASAIQREGISSSLGDGFFMVDRGELWHGYCGTIDQDSLEYLYECDADGNTDDGESLSNVVPITWVRIFDF
jgi:ABC-type transport system substrate-binding protein